MDKVRVLWLSDFACATGFAQVAHNIMEQLLKTNKYEFTVVGINHRGEPYDTNRWPFPIYPGVDITKMEDIRYRDPFGRQRLLDLLGNNEYDILFTLQDTFIMENIARQIVETKKIRIKNGQKPFQWVSYFPIDSEAKENWIKDSVLLADFPVTYTNFAKGVCQKYVPGLNLDVIYHGTNIKDFFPVSPIERKQFRDDFFEGLAEGKFVVTNVNRNQRRKDIPRTIAAFAKFHTECPDSILYLHMKADDVGGSLAEMARNFGLVSRRDVFWPKRFDEGTGYPISIINYIYNASDVVISTTLGEGWGLSSTEAMACKTPILFPDNTSLPEICAEGRCRLIRSGYSPNDFVCLGAEDMNQYRPTTDIVDMANNLAEMKRNPEPFKAMAEKAYKWVQTISWDEVGKQWQDVFDRAAAHSMTIKSGRNESCPECERHGLDNKWKKCRIHNPELSLMEPHAV